MSFIAPCGHPGEPIIGTFVLCRKCTDAKPTTGVVYTVVPNVKFDLFIESVARHLCNHTVHGRQFVLYTPRTIPAAQLDCALRASIPHTMNFLTVVYRDASANKATLFTATGDVIEEWWSIT